MDDENITYTEELCHRYSTVHAHAQHSGNFLRTVINNNPEALAVAIRTILGILDFPPQKNLKLIYSHQGKRQIITIVQETKKNSTQPKTKGKKTKTILNIEVDSHTPQWIVDLLQEAATAEVPQIVTYRQNALNHLSKLQFSTKPLEGKNSMECLHAYVDLDGKHEELSIYQLFLATIFIPTYNAAQGDITSLVNKEKDTYIKNNKGRLTEYYAAEDLRTGREKAIRRSMDCFVKSVKNLKDLLEIVGILIYFHPTLFQPGRRPLQFINPEDLKLLNDIVSSNPTIRHSITSYNNALIDKVLDTLKIIANVPVGRETVLPKFQKGKNKRTNSSSNSVSNNSSISSFSSRKKAKPVSEAYQFLVKKHGPKLLQDANLDDFAANPVEELRSLNYTNAEIDKLFGGDSEKYLGEGWNNFFETHTNNTDGKTHGFEKENIPVLHHPDGKIHGFGTDGFGTDGKPDVFGTNVNNDIQMGELSDD